MKEQTKFDRCSKCNVIFKLTKKGLLSRHSRFNGSGRIVCEGSGKAPLKAIAGNA